jgi:hypothetical protein
MNRFVLSLAIAAFVLGALLWLSTGLASAADAEAGFARIFNGKDLTKWEGEPSWWSVEDGAITGQITPEKPMHHRCTYLFWRGGRPADFELRAVYRIQGREGNSGINFRSRELPRWDCLGYQADLELKPDAAWPNYSGLLYEANQRRFLVQHGQKVTIDEAGGRTVAGLAIVPDYPKTIRPNDWNEYTIIARGPEIVLKINGAVTSHVIDRQRGKAAAEGLIALQLHGDMSMKVQFKNIRIKDLAIQKGRAIEDKSH